MNDSRCRAEVHLHRMERENRLHTQCNVHFRLLRLMICTQHTQIYLDFLLFKVILRPSQMLHSKVFSIRRQHEIKAHYFNCAILLKDNANLFSNKHFAHNHNYQWYFNCARFNIRTKIVRAICTPFVYCSFIPPRTLDINAYNWTITLSTQVSHRSLVRTLLAVCSSQTVFVVSIDEFQESDH